MHYGAGIPPPATSRKNAPVVRPGASPEVTIFKWPNLWSKPQSSA